MKLTYEQIVTESLALVEEHGLPKLSMRALADRLGMQQSSLYWYVRGKDELLGRMVARLYGAALAATPPAQDWREWLANLGHSYRATLRAQRDASKMCAMIEPVFDDQDAAAGAIMAALIEHGVPADRALLYQASVMAMVIGWLVIGDNRRLSERLSKVIDEDRAFDTGLRAMIAGFPDGDAA